MGGRKSLTACGGEISIHDGTHMDVPWVLRNNETGAEIPIWPSDIAEITSMLTAFERRAINGEDEFPPSPDAMQSESIDQNQSTQSEVHQ